MLVGILIIAVVTGLLGGGFALMLGLPVWLAILVYCITGSVAVVLVALGASGTRRGSRHPATGAVVSVPSGK